MKNKWGQENPGGVGTLPMFGYSLGVTGVTLFGTKITLYTYPVLDNAHYFKTLGYLDNENKSANM